MLNYPLVLVATWFLPALLCLIIPLLFLASNGARRLVSSLLSPKDEYTFAQAAEQKV